MRYLRAENAQLTRIAEDQEWEIVDMAERKRLILAATARMQEEVLRLRAIREQREEEAKELEKG